MNKEKVFNGVIWILIGVAMAIVFLIIIMMHTPVQQVESCKDGWSTQEKDGKVYKTYIEESDTCKDRR